MGSARNCDLAADILYIGSQLNMFGAAEGNANQPLVASVGADSGAGSTPAPVAIEPVFCLILQTSRFCPWSCWEATLVGPSGRVLRRGVAPAGIPGPIDGEAGPDKPIAHIGAGHVAASHNSPVPIPINLGTGYRLTGGEVRQRVGRLGVAAELQAVRTTAKLGAFRRVDTPDTQGLSLS